MSLLITLIFSVTGLVVTLMAAGIWLWRRPRSETARRVLIAATVFYAATSVYVVPFSLARLWNAGYRRLTATDVPSGTAGIVVLGAGGLTIVGWDNTQISVLSEVGWARVLEATRIYHSIQPAWIIAAGGLIDPDDTAVPSAILMRDAFVRAGIPGSKIVMETTSRNTHEDTMLTASLIRSMQIDHVILVTSDVHMRRSMGAFRAQGVHAIPAIAPHPLLSVDWIEWLLPRSRSLSYSGELAHEIAGLPYYWIRGWWRK